MPQWCPLNLYFEVYARTLARSWTWLVVLTLGDVGELTPVVCLRRSLARGFDGGWASLLLQV